MRVYCGDKFHDVMNTNSLVCSAKADLIGRAGRDYRPADRSQRKQLVRNIGVDAKMETCEIESCVRGHHVYKIIWSPLIEGPLDLLA